MQNANRKLAIIDIGSNTIRLVIYWKNKFGKYKEEENIKSVARLRHYLVDNGNLHDQGISILVNCLKGFKEIIEFHKVEVVKCVATATIRQALNKEDVLDIVKEQTGFKIDILSEKEEAYYGYFAVIQTTPITEGVTIDMGGGSTEITYFQNRELKYSHSFPFGVVSLKEQFIKGDTISFEEKESLIKYIQESLQQLPWLKNLQVPIIAIGGSARTVAQIDQNLKKYPLAGIHQYTMSTRDLKEILDMVERLNPLQIEKLEGVSKDRADIILPALEVFFTISEYVRTEKFMFSKKGLREGIYLKEYEKNREITEIEVIVSSNIQELVHDYGISAQHSNHVAQLAKQIYTQLEIVRGLQLSSEIKKMIDLSSRLYYVGQIVDSDVSSQHTFYYLANTSIDGLEHKDRLKLALIASFKNKALLKQYSAPFENWFTRAELQEIRIAGAITKIASALDASKRGVIKDVSIQNEFQNNKLIFTIDGSGNLFAEKYQAEKQLRHLEKAIKKNIQLVFIH
ncbi:Ppx/GppA family phosphatase [Neobacillus massiliamazoniensis]|uniref:Ppx/GppA phosphatase n=1 Tax=Neobacillus massiliamazoniensis TaxID=1499688 RepID=A0A0U1NZ29_9BACI|nr:Ppx/GppA family phosphatase [Neobacillus massiliamazoniensis]CRK83237.1 Ppx/GppA phosphatase [Neobacillus massiliamazoniensis]